MECCLDPILNENPFSPRCVIFIWVLHQFSRAHFGVILYHAMDKENKVMKHR